jgi:hypothetical protein
MSLAFTPRIKSRRAFFVAINYTGQATLSTIGKSFFQFRTFRGGLMRDFAQESPRECFFLPK